ncbi:hypothetical protein FRC10_005299 [Ceratobasidium sp. 414]|nr:hypothetical protein FRC10_005299 [Ceratobasidium sp. 414]
MSKLLQQAQEQADEFKAILQQVNSTEFAGNLDAAEQGALNNLVATLPGLGKDAREAKKKLEQVGKRKYTKKKTAQPSKKSRPSEPFDKPGFGQTLLALMSQPPFSLGAFFDQLMVKGGVRSTHADDITCAFLLISQGVEGAEPKQIRYAQDEMLNATVSSLPFGGIGSLNNQDLERIYLATDTGVGAALEQRSELDLVQHILHTTSALRFLLAWQDLNNQQHPNKAKATLTLSIFRRCHELTADTAVDTQSTDYLSFVRKRDNYLRGANRLLRAYKTMGSLVLLCPQLGFHVFCNSRVGNDLSALVKTMEELLQDQKTEMAKRERTHRDLLRCVLSTFDCSDGQLVAVLDDLEKVVSVCQVGEF